MLPLKECKGKIGKEKEKTKEKGREREEQGRKEIGNFFRLVCLTLKEN